MREKQQDGHIVIHSVYINTISFIFLFLFCVCVGGGGGGLSLSKHLFKGQLSSQLCAQHHHPCNPKEDEITACLQDGIGVEALEVRGLKEVKL